MNRDTHRLTAILATRVTVIRECACAIGMTAVDLEPTILDCASDGLRADSGRSQGSDPAGSSAVHGRRRWPGNIRLGAGAFVEL